MRRVNQRFVGKQSTICHAVSRKDARRDRWLSIPAKPASRGGRRPR
jgi:hypothetical protein